MPTIKVLYCRHHHWSTPLLRTETWSAWSHCAVIMDGDLAVVDATYAFKGVQERWLDPIISGASKYDIREIECPNPQAAYAFLRAQIGKPYDLWGALGIGLHRDWQADDAWFCSELVEAALAAGGNQRFINNAHRVTPETSWMVR